MERLKKAMELARAQRESIVGPSPGVPGDTAGKVRAIRAQTPRPLVDVKVDYTRTTSIPINAEWLREQRIILSEGAEPFADAYKVLRTHVLQRMRVNGWKTLAVTSPGIGNGKTVTAINLAISLAREVNQTILLVDLDLRRPSIGRYFVKGRTLGISDYLTGEAELADLLINPGIERLVILPGNDSFTHSSEMLSSPRVIQLVDELKGRYQDRLILFDMPPLLAGDDVIAFLPYLDAVMLVVEEGKVTSEELQQAQDLLGEKKSMGIVLNKAEPGSAGAGYYRAATKTN